MDMIATFSSTWFDLAIQRTMLPNLALSLKMGFAQTWRRGRCVARPIGCMFETEMAFTELNSVRPSLASPALGCSDIYTE